MRNTRVPGHGLISEGIAHDDDGLVIYRNGSHGGEGRAKCSCGALSEWLPSSGARRRWHNGHKVEVSAAAQ